MEPSSMNKNSYNFLCFFCLCSTYSEIEGNDCESFHQLTFRNISRYLHLIQNQNSDSHWFICQNCSQMAVNFNELYHLLEVTKMELNWCLERVLKVMTNENEKQMNTSFQVNTSNDDRRRNDFRDAVLVQIEKMTPLPPRVTLCKTENLKDYIAPSPQQDNSYFSGSEDEKMDSEEPIHSPCQSISSSLVDKSEMKMENEEDMEINDVGANSIQKTQRINLKWEEGSPAEDLETASHFKAKLKRFKGKVRGKFYKCNIVTNNPSQKFKCSFCRAEFDNQKLTGDTSLHRHVAHYHCDQLFPNHRLPRVTVPQFKKILGMLLWKDLINLDTDTVCPFCSKQFKCPKTPNSKVYYISLVKEHLIQDHFEDIEKKLKKFQENSNLSTILEECASVGEVCDCGVYLQNFAAQDAHTKWHCRLTTKYVSKTKTSKINRSDNDTNLLSNFITPKSSNKNVKFVCKSCKHTYSSRKNALRHWKHSCVNGKREAVTAPGGDSSMTCEYCGKKCINRAWNGRSKMKYHYLRCHPEHFFINERNDSLSKWKLKHFKRIVIQVLFPEFILETGNNRLECSLCGVKYNSITSKNNSVLLKTHLINKHTDVLKQKLKAILDETDKSLKEKMDADNMDQDKVLSFKTEQEMRSTINYGRQLKQEDALKCGNLVSESYTDSDPPEVSTKVKEEGVLQSYQLN